MLLALDEAAHPGVVRAASVLPGNAFRLGPTRDFGKLPGDTISFNHTPDQQGPIALVPTSKAPPASFTVVLNWRAELPAER